MNNRIKMMSDRKNFRIENGVLIKYKGTDSDVIIPQGVTSIGKKAFSGCKHLQSIVISDTVTNIGICAFHDCKKLQTVTFSDGITHIDAYAFSHCTELKHITLPESITHIGDYAFSYCKNLQNITLPKGLTRIECGLFCDCKSLKSITIPESVTNIGLSAFLNCESLRNLTIPQSVTEIGENAFLGCKSLADANGMIIIRGVLYDYFGQDSDISFPDDLTRIGSCAFRECETVQSIVLPEGVTKIGYQAFTYCSHLQTVKIPDTVTDIDMWAFHYCHNLKSISIGNGIRHLGREVFPDQMINPRAWTLAPDSKDKEQAKMLIDKIGTQNLAFSFLSGTLVTNPILHQKLQNRIINKKFREQFLPFLIEKRETKAIAKMLSLIPQMPPEEIDSYIEKAVNIAEITALLLDYKNRLYTPEALDRMDEIQTEKAFGLREKTLADYKKIFSIKKENSIYSITKYKGTEPTVLIPAQIRSIPVRFTLKECTALTDVILEDGHTEIASDAFFACSELKTVTIPESVSHIGANAFSKCPNITVCAPKGSFAELYAKENNIKFQAV